MRRAFLSACLLFACSFAVSAAGQTKPRLTTPISGVPSSMLYIGNSFFYYNNSLHGHVARFVREGAPERRYRSSSATISGAGLSWFEIEPYLRPDGVGSYTFDGDNNLVFAEPGRKRFDVAIMMDCSICPIHPQMKPVFAEVTVKHAASLRRQGVEPVLFMSWAYKDKPEMTAQLAEAYIVAGNAIDAVVIPAGLAFARSIAARPDLELYTDDKRHPSLAGTYLAAATVYATMFKRSPLEITYTAGLDPAIARHLRATAWAEVEAFHPQ